MINQLITITALVAIMVLTVAARAPATTEEGKHKRKKYLIGSTILLILSIAILLINYFIQG